MKTFSISGHIVVISQTELGLYKSATHDRDRFWFKDDRGFYYASPTQMKEREKEQIMTSTSMLSQRRVHGACSAKIHQWF